MTRQSHAAPQAPLTLREALRKVWEADKYPILGNEDWRIAARLDAEALTLAEAAIPSPDDPPEFAMWVATLRTAGRNSAEGEAVMTALHDLFDPEAEPVPER